MSTQKSIILWMENWNRVLIMYNMRSMHVFSKMSVSSTSCTSDEYDEYVTTMCMV